MAILSFRIAHKDVPTFGQMLNYCRKHRVTETCIVLMSNDDLALVRFGPRGGTKRIKTITMPS